MGSFRNVSPARDDSDRAAARRRLALVAAGLGADRSTEPPGQRLDRETAHDRSAGDLAAADATTDARHRAPALTLWQRLVGAVADQLPVARSRPASERGVTGQHVTVVALLTAALVTAGAWWVLSGRPQERAAVPLVHAPVSATPTEAPPSPGGETGGLEPAGPPDTGSLTSATTPVTGTGGSEVVVDVAGRVRRPGLVVLPSGARVADALESAGGVLARVDLTSVNLARTLLDGEQLLIGVRTAPVAVAPSPGQATGSVPTAAVPGSAAPLVDLNAATMEQLDTLPGIGPVTGQAILDWRTANGAFTTVDELLEVDGIGDATLADLRDSVTVGPGAQ